MAGISPLTHGEIEFLSEDEEVDIVPSVTIDKLDFISVEIL